MFESRLLVITGRVQGVGFRQHMTVTAIRIGVRGWVRNRRDGSVESLINGTPQQLAEILAWSARGPALAKVEAVVVAEVEAGPLDNLFAQRDTH